jgi:hypothetical protein
LAVREKDHRDADPLALRSHALYRLSAYRCRRYDEEFRALARSLRAARGTGLSPLFDALSERERRIFAHERYHFWQGLRLPFVHLYALLTLRTAFLGAGKLAKVEPDWRRWHECGVTPRGFDRLDLPFHLAGNRSGRLTFGWESRPGSEFNLTATEGYARVRGINF